jgi:Trk K+ transport system NAD-binding subunit
MKKNKSWNERGNISLKDRFNYWFDNRVTKGSLGLIKALIAASVALAVLIAGLIILFRFNEEGEVGSVFWNSIATVINAWMPYFDEGSPGYLILMSVTAIAGVLFTSVLIGIITSAIEEKIIELKRGNSRVLESGHTVVLGFYPGEYTLIRQLILAAAEKPDCIVIADEREREEMEQEIGDNLDVPKNVKIVCRTVDITDPSSIEKCSLENCKTVIVSPTDDSKTTKIVLAVSALLEEKEISGVQINAIISKNEYRFPPSLAKTHNISTLQTSAILAKMIAHSCTQTGLSQTFRELFNFEGSEFYLIELPGAEGQGFEELMLRLNRAVPVGIFSDGVMRLNPSSDYRIKKDDRILVFSEEDDSAKLEEMQGDDLFESEIMLGGTIPEEPTETVIIGSNEMLPSILKELPENVSRVYLAGAELTEKARTSLEKIAAKRSLVLNYCEGDLYEEEFLIDLAKMAQHIVILNAHGKDEEAADMETIFRLLNLRDIRDRFGFDFNITVEMQKEHNQYLVGRGDHTDFLVTSSMSSLFLAQLAENPELVDVFREILSNEGNELYLKQPASVGLDGTRTMRELRRQVLRHGYILLGIVDKDKHSRFNLPLDEIVTLGEEDEIIVLGEN